MFSTSGHRLTRRVAAAAVALAPLLTGCRGAPDALGTGPAAQQRSSHFFGALASRFTNVERDAKFAAARGRLVNGALTPASVFRDTAVWNGGAGPTRTLTLRGALAGDRYRLVSAPQAPGPVRPGDGRHVIALTRLSDEEFRWSAGVDFSLGAAGAANVGSTVHALLTSADGLTANQARAAYRAAFPRTTLALGQLASVDSLRVARVADGSSLLTMTILLQPDQVAQRYPAFAEYLRKYVQTGRLRFVVLDDDGAVWLRTDARDNRVRVQLRTLAGELVPLSGSARPMPDTLRVVADVFARASIFTVGATSLELELVRARGEAARSWTFTGRREPRWHLPLAAARLLRTPLARPFMDEGVLFRIGVRDTAGVTLLERRTAVTVQESAILRFLGRFGSTIAGDFDSRVEQEEYRFLREVFSAMGADVQVLLR